jgi:quercetin dioxygenase-like cupin family protein
MEPLIFDASDGEVYDTCALRLRMLAQSPDHPLSMMESTVPPGFPGVVRHRHAQMTDIFYVLEGELAVEIGDEWHMLGPSSFALDRLGSPTRSPILGRRRPGS